MTPEQELYLALCVLTVLEGVHWLPRDAVGFLRTYRTVRAGPSARTVAAHHYLPRLLRSSPSS